MKNANNSSFTTLKQCLACVVWAVKCFWSFSIAVSVTKPILKIYRIECRIAELGLSSLFVVISIVVSSKMGPPPPTRDWRRGLDSDKRLCVAH